VVLPPVNKDQLLVNSSNFFSFRSNSSTSSILINLSGSFSMPVIYAGESPATISDSVAAGSEVICGIRLISVIYRLSRVNFHSPIVKVAS
jgi:hypothetical protein